MGGKCTIANKEMVQSIVEQSVHLKKELLFLKDLMWGEFFLYIKSQKL